MMMISLMIMVILLLSWVIPSCSGTKLSLSWGVAHLAKYIKPVIINATKLLL